MTEKRKKALRKRRIFISLCCAVLVLLVSGVIFGTNAIIKTVKSKSSDKKISAETKQSDIKKTADPAFDDSKQLVTIGGVELDANFKNLLLVNNSHPLSDDYDYTADLTTIPEEYHNGQLDQINKYIWPYLKAMIDDARKEGVNLSVWSPYRSKSIQQMLFDRQKQKQIAAGVPESEADAKAATIVARPGTSEHHTGLAADINMADEAFENTPMYAWLTEHCQDYGFIMRYPKDKTDVTGVIYESWHYRFVGINVAKDIKNKGITLEEYLELKGIA